MKSIIEELYDHLDLPAPVSDPERKETIAQLDPLVKRVQERFGLDFVDEFTGLHADLCAIGDLHAFRMGFITGAKLMMEVFTLS